MAVRYSVFHVLGHSALYILKSIQLWKQNNTLVSSYTFIMWVESNEPPHEKTNKMACAPSEDSDQPGHPPSLIRVFTVRMKKAWVLSFPLSAQQRLWSDWADVQAVLSLRWAHMSFVGFVMRRLKYWVYGTATGGFVDIITKCGEFMEHWMVSLWI